MDEVIKLRRALEAGLEYAIDAANDCKAKDRMFDQIMNDVRRIEAEIDRIKRTNLMGDDVISRVEAWLGSPKETKKHPTVMLHTDKTARVIALDDLRELLALARSNRDVETLGRKVANIVLENATSAADSDLALKLLTALDQQAPVPQDG